MSTKVIWKTIYYKGFTFDYKVSNDGRVKSLKSNKILKPWLRGSREGKYLCVRLYDSGFKVTVDIHRLVASMFIPNNEPYLKNEVNHFDENHMNNHVDNLEWVSRSENEQHKRFMKGCRGVEEKCQNGKVSKTTR